MTKIAVIGSRSLIAKEFLKFLNQQECEVLLFGREQLGATNFNFPESKVDLTLLKDCDWIFYFAGAGIQPKSNPSAEELYGINCFEPIRMFEGLNQLGYKGNVVTFGSYFEIGRVDTQKAFNEEELIFSKHEVLNSYASSKRLFSRYIYDVTKKDFAFKFTHFYLPNIYSAYENQSRLIPYLLHSVKNGNSIHLSNGNQQRQYVHVKDICKFLVGYCKNAIKYSGYFNLGNTTAITVKDIVKEVTDQSENHGYAIPEITFGVVERRDSFAPFLLLEDEKARNELSWYPTIDLNQGINEYFKVDGKRD